VSHHVGKADSHLSLWHDHETDEIDELLAGLAPELLSAMIDEELPESGPAA